MLVKAIFLPPMILHSLLKIPAGPKCLNKGCTSCVQLKPKHTTLKPKHHTQTKDHIGKVHKRKTNNRN